MALMSAKFYDQNVEMITFSGGGYVDGRYTGGVQTTTPILASVQPLSDRDRDRLPEGFRASEAITLYIEDVEVPVIHNNEATTQDAAKFIYKGNHYAMVSSRYYSHAFRYYKVVAVLED